MHEMELMFMKENIYIL